MLLEGLHLPLTTPFYSDGRLNLRKLEHNVALYSKTPVAGLVALGQSGEPTMLSDEEMRLALRSVAASAVTEKVLVAGVSRDSVAGTLDLAEYAAKLSYDAILVKPSAIFRGTIRETKELFVYFQIIADRSALPIVLFSGSQHQLPVEAVVELASHQRIIGLVDGIGGRERIETIKSQTATVKHDVNVTAVFAAVTERMLASRKDEAVGSLISLGSLVNGETATAVPSSKQGAKIRTKTVGFQVLVGRTTGILEGLLAGAVGAMPAFAACAPQGCYEVLAACKDGDESLAREKQVRLQAVAERIEEALGIAGLKYGCDLNGYYGGPARLPLLPLLGTERGEIEALMQGLRN